MKNTFIQQMDYRPQKMGTWAYIGFPTGVENMEGSSKFDGVG